MDYKTEIFVLFIMCILLAFLTAMQADKVADLRQQVVENTRLIDYQKMYTRDLEMRCYCLEEK